MAVSSLSMHDFNMVLPDGQYVQVNGDSYLVSTISTSGETRKLRLKPHYEKLNLWYRIRRCLP